MATTIDTVTAALNSLLRGEMSAIETYRQAIEKMDNELGSDVLHMLRVEHRDAADALWHHIENHGGKPSEDSGPWGSFAKAVEGTAKLFGNVAALKALKEGEEHGLKDYEEALKEEGLPADCQALIHGLMEKQRAHIPLIDRLLSQHP